MSNPTAGVWTLDSNLNGTPSPLVGVDPIRFDGGLWVEEGTTNHIVNADFATNTSGWTVNGTGSVVLTRRTDTGLADHVCQVACDGAGASQGIFLSNGVTASVGQTWAFTVDIAGAVGGETCRMTISMRNGGGSQISELVSDPFLITGDLVRYTYVATLTEATTAAVRVKVLGPASATALTFFVDQFQFENKGHATSFALSTMGDGYSAGAGSVHVRAASSASVTIAEPASVACWYREGYSGAKQFAYLSPLGTLGTYGSIAYAAGDLTISTSRNLVIGPFAAFDRELTANEQANLRSTQNWSMNSVNGSNIILPLSGRRRPR